MARSFLYGAVAAVSMVALPARSATLEVVVANVRSNKGHVRVAACTAGTFLKESCQVNGDAPAAIGEVLVRLEVPPGVWAVQAFLDEDDDKAINRSFFGLPTEGLGFSNDAPFRFGPPSFADAAISLTPGGGRIRLNLRYY